MVLFQLRSSWLFYILITTVKARLTRIQDERGWVESISSSTQPISIHQHPHVSYPIQVGLNFIHDDLPQESTSSNPFISTSRDIQSHRFNSGLLSSTQSILPTRKKPRTLIEEIRELDTYKPKVNLLSWGWCFDAWSGSISNSSHSSFFFFSIWGFYGLTGSRSSWWREEGDCRKTTHLWQDG